MTTTNMLVAGLSVSLFAGIIGYNLIMSRAPVLLPALQDTMSRWSGVAITDADQCFLGIIPGAREGAAAFRDGHDQPADEKTLLVTTVPDGFWNVAVALEHRSIGTWRTIPNLGVDVFSLTHALYDTASGNPRGASTLPQLVAGALLKTDHGSHSGWLTRKAREITNGAALYSSYSLAPSENQNFRQLVASYIPLAQSSASGRGGALYGIGVTGLVLFGRKPEDLDLAQQAVLAAAIKMPILLAPANDMAGQALAQRIFERVKARAIYGIEQAYDTDGAGAARAIAEIKSMPLPSPHLCEPLKGFLPDDPVHAFQVSFNPVWRAQYFADEELSQAVSELRTVAGSEFRERIAEIRLSVRERENFPFKQQVRGALQALEHEHADGLSIGLTAASSRAPGDVLLAGADDSGRLRLFYQSPERALLDVPRATGSVSKVLAAVSLAQSSTPDQTYCNLRIDGVLANANGDTGRAHCYDPGGNVVARDAFRKSLNLPVYYALGSKSDRDLRRIANVAGFSPFPDLAPRTALAFGMVEASPASMLRLMTAATRAAQGKPALARNPRIIASIIWRGQDKPAAMPSRVLDLSPYLAGGSANRFVASVLSAPLDEGGTAASLEKCGDAMNWELAKTGTVAQGHRVGSKLLVASGAFQGRPLTMIGVVGTVADNGNVTPIKTSMVAHVFCEATTLQTKTTLAAVTSRDGEDLAPALR